ncbi:MAG TPA: helix-turn-helix transcriptional regulator [Chloroflexota bacterium]|jgi:predicted XRE-type DNA-binding protein|nr:helix-turn-helix transcriptional regulator [Chloroflexota bacterium]
MREQTDIAVTPSGGNVFADLGSPDAEDRLVKAELARQIAKVIRERGLTQTAAARVLGTDQPKISALVTGQLAGFSLERLAHFLTLLGKDVQIVVREKPAERPAGRLTVVSA